MIEKNLLAKVVELPNVGTNDPGQGGNNGFGAFADIVSQGPGSGYSSSVFAAIISNVVGIITVVAGIWFIFSFILGAFGFLTAGGDKPKVEESSKKLTQAVLGLVVVVAAYALMSLLGSILGFNFLDFATLVEGLGAGQ